MNSNDYLNLGYATAIIGYTAMTMASSFLVSQGLSRQIYVLSKYDKKDVGFEEEWDFIAPNLGSRFDAAKYNQLSLIEHLVRSSLLLLTGALTCSLLTKCILDSDFSFIAPASSQLIVQISCIVGAILGAVNEPRFVAGWGL